MGIPSIISPKVLLAQVCVYITFGLSEETSNNKALIFSRQVPEESLAREIELGHSVIIRSQH